MTTNSNFRVKNGLEVAEQAVIDGITLSNSSGTFAAQIITPESTSTTSNSSTIALITDIGGLGVVDAMIGYNGDTPNVSGSPTYSTSETKFDSHSWNNQSNTNNYIQAFSGGGYDFSSMGSASNWTIDMWIYTKSGASGSGNQTLVNGSGFGDGPSNIWFGVDNDVPLSGTLRAGNGGSNDIVGPQMPGTETWHHVGMMRKAGVLYFLLNGTTTAAPSNPTLTFGPGLEFLGGTRNNPFGLGFASRIRVSPATSLFDVGTYTLPVEADYDPAGGISVTIPASTTNALDYNSLANKPTIPPAPNQSLDTDDNVQFNTVNAGNGIATNFLGDASGSIDSGTYLELGRSANDYTLIGINANITEFWSNSHGAQNARIDSNGIKINRGRLEFADGSQLVSATTQTNFAVTNKLTVAGIALEGANTSTLKLSYNTTIAGNDTFFADVEVLARGAALDDDSTNNSTVTASGSAVAGSTGQTNLEAGSFYSPGTSSDFITIDTSPSLNYGTGNFTIDFWVYTEEDATSGMKTMASDWAATKWIIQGGDGDNEYYALLDGSGGGGQQFVYFDITPDQWNHIAIVRESNSTFKVYVDGVLDDTNTGISGKDLGTSGDIKLFINGDGNQQPFPGYIEDFRVTTAARYTSGFTPPAAASDYDLGSNVATTASIRVASLEFADGTSVSTANGLSGYSGFSGYSGVVGAQGETGASGYSGVVGAQGETGASGYSGYSGVVGAEGPQGFQGVSGYSGVAGATGETGASGYSGAVGTSGYSGYSGPGANQSLNTSDSVTFANIDLKKFDEQVYNWGTVSTGTVWIDVNSGTIHRMTLGGNITMNAFTGTVVTGTSVTVVLKQDATGSRTLTSTMKFSGGSKTLSTAGTTTDVISVFYDGVDYLAALTKGFV
jgi:hypothetical protein